MSIVREPVGVLLVEASITDREFLVGLLSSNPGFKLLATARNGQRAIDVLKTIPRPGLILMNLEMPVMDGIQATRSIMESQPVPIVVLSARLDASETQRSFKAMEAGALAAVSLPPKPGVPGHESGVAELFDPLISGFPSSPSTTLAALIQAPAADW